MTSIHVLHKIYLLSTKSLPETHTFRWRELDSETFSSLALLRLKGRFSYWRGPVWSRRPQPIAEQHWRTVRTPGVIFTYAQLDMLANYRFQTDYRQNCGFAVSPIRHPLIKRRVNMPTRRLALNSLTLLRVGSCAAGIFSSIICMAITDFFFYMVLFGCTLPKQSIHNKDYVCFNNYLSNHVPLISIVITFVSWKRALGEFFRNKLLCGKDCTKETINHPIYKRTPDTAKPPFPLWSFWNVWFSNTLAGTAT